MAEPQIVEAWGVVEVTLGDGVNVKEGSLLAYSGTAWVLADADEAAADSGVYRYARLIAMETRREDDDENAATCRACKRAILQDTDAPYTLGDKQYLSATAGAMTATRPTVNGSTLVQVVGQAISTSQVELSVGQLHEVPVPIVLTGATSAYAVLDSGDFGGPTLDAQNETLSLVACLPPNCVGSVGGAQLFLAAEATAGTPTADITVSSAEDGAQWDAVTADATLVDQAREGAAADEMQVLDISTGLDATDIINPGKILGIKVLQDDAGTDISFVFGGLIMANCVGP